MKGFGSRMQGLPLPLHSYLGADPSTKIGDLKIDGHDWFKAAKLPSMCTVTAFLVSGQDPNVCEPDTGYTALHYAAEKGQLLMTRVLIDDGATVDARGRKHGVTPLALALQNGHVDVAMALVDNGADPLLRLIDESSEPVLFQGISRPIAFHAVAMRAKLMSLASLTNDHGESMLHLAAAMSGRKARHAVLCLVEQHGLNVDHRDNKGRTAMHHAARAKTDDAVKALLLAGANPTLTDNDGAAPATMRGSLHAALIRRVAAEPSVTGRERLCAVDYRNWSTQAAGWWKPCLLTLVLPPVAVELATRSSPMIGCAIVTGVVIYFGIIANFAMSQKRRSLLTPSFYTGMFALGCAVVYQEVFPFLQEQYAHGDVWCWLWVVAAAGMYMCYMVTSIADPGVVQSSAKSRADIYDCVMTGGESRLKAEGFDVTTMVRKPLRAKHCSMTHATVKRFDHFCVWTGNAIGGGNHRPFVWFCILQVLVQALNAWWSLDILRRKMKSNTVLDFFDTALQPDNLRITLPLVVLNSVVFLFVSVIAPSQLYYAARNVTSNEMWFADRYRWMVKLGKTAYCLYDRGAPRNLVDFFVTGDLVAEEYDVPPMNEYLLGVSRRFAKKMKTSHAVHGDAPHDGASPGMSPVPTVVAGQAPVSAASPSDQLQAMQSAMPADAAAHMQAVQGMLQQMIAGQEPTPPPGVDGEKRGQMLHQVKVMHQHFLRMTKAPAQTQQPTAHPV